MTQPIGIDKTYSTSELLKMAYFMGIHLNGPQIRDWHRRQILKSEPVGKGIEREYGFKEIVFILSLALMADRVRYLHHAKQLAQVHAAAVIEVYETGPDGAVVDKVPAQVLVVEFGTPVVQQLDRALSAVAVAKIYACRGAVLLHPGQFAMNLQSRIMDCLAWREGLPDGMSYVRK
jgi:hypothetical protein